LLAGRKDRQKDGSKHGWKQRKTEKSLAGKKESQKWKAGRKMKKGKNKRTEDRRVKEEKAEEKVFHPSQAS